MKTAAIIIIGAALAGVAGYAIWRVMRARSGDASPGSPLQGVVDRILSRGEAAGRSVGSALGRPAPYGGREVSDSELRAMQERALDEAFANGGQ